MELLKKSQEAALTAIKVFNDPLIKFKSETYIVLMIIAWTYLLHAFYRGSGIEYRYFRLVGNRRRFDRTKHGSYKYWELERCLAEERCPVDSVTRTNLRFLIGLRHEIEHQMTSSLDSYLSGRYQACALNYNHYLKRMFGSACSLDEHLSFSIQFFEFSAEQVVGGRPQAEIPAQLRAYLVEFDSRVQPEEFDDPRFAYRLLFTRRLANRRGQADSVVEFIDPKTAAGETIEKAYWIQKEVERPKYLPSAVAAAVRSAGFSRFRVQPEHVRMWKSENAKNPALGYGVEVQGTWFWYERWIDRCIELCESAGNRYK